MLVLSRNVGQTLVIGDSISVTILGVNGKQVRIGVNAPRDVAVNRKEIHDRIVAEGDRRPR